MITPLYTLARLLLLLLLPIGQESGPVLEAHAGFDGYYKPTAAVPVTVTARNDGAAVDGEIRVLVSGSSGPGELIYSAPLSLPAGADKRIPLVVYAPPFAGQLTVQLVSDDGAT